MKKSSVFDDYVAGLKHLQNEDYRVELENFYTFHSAVLQYFKGIESAVKDVLKLPIVSPIVIQQLTEVLPTLNRLKLETEKLATETFAAGYKTKITQTASHIKNNMSLSEVENLSQELFIMLKENNEAKIAEKAHREKLAKPLKAICTNDLGPFEFKTFSRKLTCHHCGQMLTFHNYGDFKCPTCKKIMPLWINYTCKRCKNAISINRIEMRYKDASFKCPQCNKRGKLSNEFVINRPAQNGKRRLSVWGIIWRLILGIALFLLGILGMIESAI